MYFFLRLRNLTALCCLTPVALISRLRHRTLGTMEVSLEARALPDFKMTWGNGSVFVALADSISWVKAR